MSQRESVRQVLSPRGVLTGASAESMLDYLRTTASDCAQVEIDFSAVTEVDRAGATALLDAYVATILRHAAFSITGASPTCVDALKRFGVLDVVDVNDATTRCERRPS